MNDFATRLTTLYQRKPFQRTDMRTFSALPSSPLSGKLTCQRSSEFRFGPWKPSRPPPMAQQRTVMPGGGGGATHRLRLRRARPGIAATARSRVLVAMVSLSLPYRRDAVSWGLHCFQRGCGGLKRLSAVRQNMARSGDSL